MSNKKEQEIPEEENSTTAGNIGRVIDYAFNPSKDKIREMTNISRLQAAAFPLLDVKTDGLKHCLAIAAYNVGEINKIPIMPDLSDTFVHRTAQWQKSIKGSNLEKAVQLAMAEIESEGMNHDPLRGIDYDD
jgi:hypothetical protein|tara:strand:+ start:2301 stop:2696 length:396 start_codon:yes stop_codon:yes gene_type:complete